MSAAAGTSRPAAFLDRDGTLIVERGYLDDPAGVELEEGAVKGLRALQALGLVLVVVTNQSGIARGYFSEAAAAAVNARVADLLAAEGVHVEGWYLCPHGPGDDCDCRKPGPGMALAAARDLGLDLERSVVIGDKRADLGLAAAIGARGLLVRTGYGAREAAGADPAQVVDDLPAAAALLAG